MSSPLKNLAKIISFGIDTLESAYAEDGLTFPSLNEPFTPTPLDGNVELESTVQLIVAAAAQIIATVRAPMDTLLDQAPSMYTSSALGIVVDANVADVLHVAGPEGLHANQIGVQTGIESTKLARVLRYLAMRHLFREVTPNVFTNNRISSLLIKAKSLEDIKADPDTRYDGAPAASMVGFICDEGLASVPYMSPFFRDPKGKAAPFNMMIGRPTRLWDWYEEPENTWRGRRFSATMKAASDTFPSSIFTTSIDWKSLKKKDIVVDIGGSIGSTTLILARAFPHLRYIVQDLDKVIIEAHKFWKTSYPEAVTSGLVTLQPHNFFEPQPIKSATVYLMRLVIHDWPKAEVHTLLKATRAAASPSSKLIVFDTLMGYACKDTECTVAERDNPLASSLHLPISHGMMGAFLTTIDLQVMSLLGGQERTLEEFKELGEATGWNLEVVKPGPLVTLIFTPAIQ